MATAVLSSGCFCLLGVVYSVAFYDTIRYDMIYMNFSWVCTCWQRSVNLHTNRKQTTNVDEKKQYKNTEHTK